MHNEFIKHQQQKQNNKKTWKIVAKYGYKKAPLAQAIAYRQQVHQSGNKQQQRLQLKNIYIYTVFWKSLFCMLKRQHKNKIYK